MIGPYGYSDPNDATSAIRRMVTGYQQRDGSNGPYDIAANGRNLLPQWSVAINGKESTAVAANNEGPDVDDEFFLGRYMEDNAFKADLVSAASGVIFEQYNDPGAQGGFYEAQHYDLNHCNVRYCVTPEHPQGAWAYFTVIYLVESSADLDAWDETGTLVTTDSVEMVTTDSTAGLEAKFYRLTQTGLSNYDDTEFSTAAGGPPQ